MAKIEVVFPTEERAHVCLDAIRLALEVGSYPDDRLRLIAGILEHAPEPDEQGLVSVGLLVTVCRNLNAKMTVPS